MGLVSKNYTFGSYNGQLLVGTATTQTTTAAATASFLHMIGQKAYELANHLGNVLVTVADERASVHGTGPLSTTVTSYNGIVMSATDYSAFGSPLVGRNFSSTNYRYGFNGKENDPETVGTGEGTQNYGMRIYNASLGRFLSVDPLTKKYPELTPYQFASNTPIQAVDLDGLETYYASDGSFIGQYGTSTELRVVYDEDLEAAKYVVAQQGTGAPGLDAMNSHLYEQGSAATYKSMDEAAADWGKKVNPTSIKENTEYHSFIFTTKINGRSVITYTKPDAGTIDQSGGSFTSRANHRLLADIHSHGAYDPNYISDKPSRTFVDEKGTVNEGDVEGHVRTHMIGYLVTPNGSLQEIFPRFRLRLLVVICLQIPKTLKNVK